MKSLTYASLLTLALLGALVPFSARAEMAVTMCADMPNPAVVLCSTQYEPVCGVNAQGERTTYTNGCLACTQSGVVSFRDGACDSESASSGGSDSTSSSSTTSNSDAETRFTCPDTRLIKCSTMSDPACAYTNDGEVVGTFTNGCMACVMGENVKFTTRGECLSKEQREGVSVCPLTRPVMCPMFYQQTCGYSTSGAPLGDFGNPCVACGVDGVHYTKVGACSDSITDQKSRKQCTLPRGDACPEYYTPICGYDGEGKVVGDFGNECEACRETTVFSYEHGKCPIENDGERAFCPDQRPEFCTMQYDPVCAYDVEGNMIHTYGNSCSACSDESVFFSIKGECQLPSDGEYYTCPAVRPQFCTLEYIETCGYDENGNAVGTYGNKCSACADERVFKAKFGACTPVQPEKEQCPDVPPRFCTREYNPVCGYFKTTVQCIRAPCASTYANKCSACSDENVAYTVAGECETPQPAPVPGTAVKQCPVTRPLACTRDYRPACGFFDESIKCMRAPCALTYSNECEACSDPRVSYTQPGACEKDAETAEEEPCPSERPEACTDDYSPVCGLFNENIRCFRAPCGMTYGNRCSACSDPNVASTKVGTCEEAQPQVPGSETGSESSEGEVAGSSSGSSAGEVAGSSANGEVACPATRPQVCTKIYKPVCGLFNSNIMCIRAPCGATYSNECEACRDEKVASTREGVC